MDLLNHLGDATLALGQPRGLWLLLAVPLAALFTWRAGRGRGHRRWLRFALRAAVLALIAAALARPTLQRPTEALSLAVLVDVSDSVPPAALADVRGRVQALLAQTQGGRVRLHLARFAAVAEEQPIQPANTREQLAARSTTRLGGLGGDTDLGRALDAGLALLERDRVGRLLLFSDGRPTRGDHEPALERARARGVRLFAVPLASAGGPGVALLDLQAPAGVRPGASFELTARLVVTAPAQVRLRLERDGADSPPEGERTVQLPAGVTSLRWPAQLAADSAVFDLQVVAAPGTRQPRTDRARLAVVGERPPRVLVLEGAPDSTLGFRRALAAQQMQVDTGRGRLPAALAGYDLVVLAEVPASRLPAQDQHALASYVRERGGGLLVAAGSAGFGGGDYEGTTLGGLLPLRHDPGERQEEPTVALALVIDRSGSMSGPKMDLTKEAARGAAELMKPEDLIAVVAFDSQAHTVVRLQPASNRQRILADIGGIRTGGGTNILPGLREAVDQLLAASARRKHIIVLSDGQSPVEGISELVDEAAGARVTVSAVGVGDGADVAVLQMIAGRGNGRFYHTRDPASVPRIFTRETAGLSAEPASENKGHARLARRAEVLAGIPVQNAPPLLGHARARARSGAEVLLTIDGGDPLLGRWQQGLGQVLVWTSDLGARWSTGWLRWSAYPQLVGQLARSAMSRQPLRALPLVVQRTRGTVEVELQAIGADQQPHAGLEGVLEVRALPAQGPLPGQATGSVPLLERGRGHYQASLPVGDAAALVLQARLHAPGSQGPPLYEARGQLGTSPAAEGQPALPRAPQAPGQLEGPLLLEALAAGTGGRLLGADVTPVLAPASDRALRTNSLVAPLLVAALVLFLGELALRRANFRAPGRGEGAPAG